MWGFNVRRGKADPKWLSTANDDEKQRLKVIEDRLERKSETIKECLAERQRIMRRCVRRLRRAEGKE